MNKFEKCRNSCFKVKTKKVRGLAIYIFKNRFMPEKKYTNGEIQKSKTRCKRVLEKFCHKRAHNAVNREFFWVCCKHKTHGYIKDTIANKGSTRHPKKHLHLFPKRSTCKINWKKKKNAATHYCSYAYRVLQAEQRFFMDGFVLA